MGCCIEGLCKPSWWPKDSPAEQQCRLVSPHERRDLSLAARDLWIAPPRCTRQLIPRRSQCPFRQDPKFASLLQVAPSPRSILRGKPNTLKLEADVLRQAKVSFQVTPPSSGSSLLAPPPEVADCAISTNGPEAAAQIEMCYSCTTPHPASMEVLV